jgi:hypothetical protein
MGMKASARPFHDRRGLTVIVNASLVRESQYRIVPNAYKSCAVDFNINLARTFGAACSRQ